LQKIIIYTDGSGLGNPGPGGWAVLLDRAEKGLSKKVFFKSSGGEIQTTNNRMEMTAFLEALKYLAKNFSSHQLEINSDSNLIVQTINQGWKKKANQDLWSEIDEVLPKLNIKIFWVKAHATDKLNNQCDKLAFAAAQKSQKLAAKLPPAISTTSKPAKKKSQQESLF
jgi:ribonuclease HI